MNPESEPDCLISPVQQIARPSYAVEPLPSFNPAKLIHKRDLKLLKESLSVFPGSAEVCETEKNVDKFCKEQNISDVSNDDSALLQLLKSKGIYKEEADPIDNMLIRKGCSGILRKLEPEKFIRETEFTKDGFNWASILSPGLQQWTIKAARESALHKHVEARKSPTKEKSDKKGLQMPAHVKKRQVKAVKGRQKHDETKQGQQDDSNRNDTPAPIFTRADIDAVKLYPTFNDLPVNEDMDWSKNPSAFLQGKTPNNAKKLDKDKETCLWSIHSANVARSEAEHNFEQELELKAKQLAEKKEQTKQTDKKESSMLDLQTKYPLFYRTESPEFMRLQTGQLINIPLLPEKELELEESHTMSEPSRSQPDNASQYPFFCQNASLTSSHSRNQFQEMSIVRRSKPLLRRTPHKFIKTNLYTLCALVLN